MLRALYRNELTRTQELLSGYAHDEAELIQKPASYNLETNISPLFVFAGVGPGYRNVVITRLTGLFVFSVLLVLASRQPLFLGLILLGGIFEYARLKSLAFKRSEAFERDYTALLLSLASAVRTGLDPLVALAESGRLFNHDSQVGKEVAGFKRNLERGLAEEQAMQLFAVSIDHPDIRLFRTAYILARQKGSGLAECLQRLARVTRQRQSFRRKVRSAVAMQKLSAIGIAGCAIVIGLIQCVSNPEAITAALNHPMGIKLLTIGLTLIVVGLTWMMNLSRSRI